MGSALLLPRDGGFIRQKNSKIRNIQEKNPKVTKEPMFPCHMGWAPCLSACRSRPPHPCLCLPVSPVLAREWWSVPCASSSRMDVISWLPPLALCPWTPAALGGPCAEPSSAGHGICWWHLRRGSVCHPVPWLEKSLAWFWTGPCALPNISHMWEYEDGEGTGAFPTCGLRGW